MTVVLNIECERVLKQMKFLENIFAAIINQKKTEEKEDMIFLADECCRASMNLKYQMKTKSSSFLCLKIICILLLCSYICIYIYICMYIYKYIHT